MSRDRTAEILDAAYRCFARHGVRRTTMADIAAAAEISRPAIYQHLRDKNEIFIRLAERLFADSASRARAAALVPGGLTDRLTAILTVKIELVLRVLADSPHHGTELIGAGAQISSDAERRYRATLRDLLVAALQEAAATGEVPEPGPASTPAERSAAAPSFAEVAELLLAFAQGLEADLTDPRRTHRRLRAGVALFTAGLRGGDPGHQPAIAGPAGPSSPGATR